MTSEPSGAVRGPYRTGIRRRQEMIESATQVFARFGYAGGSLRQIADGIGVTPAAIFRHFGSKEGLLIAVLEHWDEDAATRVADGASGLEYFRRLPELVADHAANRGLVELFLTVGTEATDPTHPASRFMVDRYERIVAESAGHLRQAVERGEAAPLGDDEIDDEVRAVVAVLDGMQLQWLLNPSVHLERALRRYVDAAIERWHADARE
jgi:AcrR family transcriptional regulator